MTNSGNVLALSKSSSRVMGVTGRTYIESLFYRIMKTAYDQKKKQSRNILTRTGGGTMARFFRFFILISFSMALSACGALNNIYWKNGIPGGGEIMTVDAKQRHAFIFPDPVQQGRWNVCAEASPDVFSANSTALAAALNVNNKSRDGSFSFSNTEAAAAIGRTQYVNAIRESMYRTCERYLNGALSKSTFIVQAARDQRMMVALLAIEQLTGANRTQTSIISGPAANASLQNSLIDGEQAGELMKIRNARLKKTEDDKEIAEKAFTKSIEEDYDCGSKPRPDPEKDAASATAAGKWDVCNAKKQEFEKRQSDFENANLRFKEASAAVSEAASSANASTSTNNNLIGNEGSNWKEGAHLTNVSAIAKAVVEIANAPPIDEALMFCLSQLDQSEVIRETNVRFVAPPPNVFESTERRNRVVDDRILNMCVEVVKNRAVLDEVKRNSNLTADQVTAVMNRRSGYAEFRSKLVAHLRSLPDDAAVVSFLKKFEDNINKSLKTPAGSYQYLLNGGCSSKSECLAMIDGDIYFSAFSNQSEHLNNALGASLI